MSQRLGCVPSSLRSWEAQRICRHTRCLCVSHHLICETKEPQKICVFFEADVHHLLVATLSKMIHEYAGKVNARVLPCLALVTLQKLDSALLCVHAVMAPRKRTTRQRKNDPKKAKLDAFLQDFDSEGQCLFHVAHGHWSCFYLFIFFHLALQITNTSALTSQWRAELCG